MLAATRSFMIRFDASVCRNLDVSSRREWLETNGIGGFASSTVSGMNTRRYHGFLIAATQPPVGRMVLLSKMEETLVIGGRRIDLGCNRYPGVIHPQGHLLLKEFRRDPFPTFVFEIDGFELEKSVFMVHGENMVVIQYEFRGSVPDGSLIELRPLIAFRDYHGTTHENRVINPALQIEPGCVSVSPYPGCPKLMLAHTGAEARADANWYRSFEYTVEQERGLDYREDLFNPMVLTFRIGANHSASVIASTEPRDAAAAQRLRVAEIDRRARLTDTSDSFERALIQAADQFLARRGQGSTVIAGYHWFSDWGRDTMISLPGLTLATRRFDEARGILLAFAACVDRGMLPNRFSDAGETPEYNTVDATLWFFEAIRALAEATGDYAFVESHLFSVLTDIIAWHERGTRYGIRVDDDRLLTAGEPGVQLTWMDAKVGDWVVTPRHGKPVEIQALWYNALRVMEGFASRFERPELARHYADLAGRVETSFFKLFWNESLGCLYDVIAPDGRPDASIRPNQIFAISLFHNLVGGEKAKQILAVVERDLLTPYGLRTLAPSDPHYRGRYEGDQWHRDSAYHQGTVWPWLLGPYLSAYARVHGRQSEHTGDELRRYIAAEGVGQIPEVFDGNAPHGPGGCIAQAWSVAELLRAHSK
jgi:predicted glycogen debranching enzyme